MHFISPQGDQETARGLDVSPFMDRHTTQPVRCQTGFIDFIVAPLFKAWATMVPSLKPQFEECLRDNKEWLATPGCFSAMPAGAAVGRYMTENAGRGVPVIAGETEVANASGRLTHPGLPGSLSDRE